MSGRPLLIVTLPVLTVLAICLYMRRRGRSDSDPPEPPPPDQPATDTQPVTETARDSQPAAEAATDSQPMTESATESQPMSESATESQPAAKPATDSQPAAEPTAGEMTPTGGQAAGRDLSQVTAWVRDNIETRPEPEPEPTAVRTPAATVSAGPPASEHRESEDVPQGNDAKKETVPEPAVIRATGDALRELEAAVQKTDRQTDERDCGNRSSSQDQEETEKVLTETPVAVKKPQDAAKELEAVEETPVVKEDAPVTAAEAPVASVDSPVTEKAPVAESQPSAAAQESPADTESAAGPAAVPTEAEATTLGPAGAAEASEAVTGGAEASELATGGAEASEPVTGGAEASEPATGGAEASEPATGGVEASEPVTGGAEASDPATGGAETSEPATGGAEASEAASGSVAEAAADNASENSSDSGKGGSSASLEQTSPSNSPESAALQTTVYDFLIPQKLCGRLIGKNGTFVNMLKARTGAHVIIRLHPVKSSVKICSVDGTQSEIDACLKMIREKFPINKFPAMTLEQLNKPTEQSLAVPDSQQLHLPQGVTCDVLVSAVVSAGQLFLQQHTHPTFRGLERLATLMAACYTDGNSTPELPRPVVASSICAAPVAGGWYRAQVVAFYPDSDELDVRFMDYGGYSRIAASQARQIRTDFMSLPFQAEECYLANVMPVSEDGWSLEAGAVLESLITDRALEAMVVGYAEDGTPFVNLYSIQGTEYGNNAISLVNQRLVESGAARWVENQA